MNVLPLILGALCVMVIAYRFYGNFLASKVVVLDDNRKTPAHLHNYHPTSKWVLFGHHFAAIAGSGPLIGPVLAAQFGYAPGFLWLLVGVCLAGAVQDFMILAASVRRKGKSLAEIARHEISPLAGMVGSIAIFFIVVIALAGLGLAGVNALKGSSWGTFSIAMTIPIAFLVGFWMYRWRVGRVGEVGLQIASLAYGALLGVFLLGVLTKRANQRGAMIGMLFGLVTELYLWRIRVPWTWWVLVGTAVTFAIGYAASVASKDGAEPLTAKAAKNCRKDR